MNNNNNNNMPLDQGVFDSFGTEDSSINENQLTNVWNNNNITSHNEFENRTNGILSATPILHKSSAINPASKSPDFFHSYM